MENFLQEFSVKLKIKGLFVSDVFWGSDDEAFNNPPMVIFTAHDENERELGVVKLKFILKSFYNKQKESENELKITPIDGSGTPDSPRYGFIMHSGKMDDLESRDTPLKIQIQNYRNELEKFNKFLK